VSHFILDCDKSLEACLNFYLAHASRTIVGITQQVNLMTKFI